MSRPRTFAAIVATVKTQTSEVKIDNPPRYRRRVMSDPAKYLQPRQIKGEPNADKPRKDFVIVDVGGEPNRIERFDRSCVNEHSANNHVRNSPNKFHFRDLSHSSQPP